jgi:hypothetical protein
MLTSICGSANTKAKAASGRWSLANPIAEARALREIESSGLMQLTRGACYRPLHFSRINNRYARACTYLLPFRWQRLRLSANLQPIDTP